MPVIQGIDIQPTAQIPSAARNLTPSQYHQPIVGNPADSFKHGETIGSEHTLSQHLDNVMPPLSIGNEVRRNEVNDDSFIFEKLVVDSGFLLPTGIAADVMRKR